MVGTAAVAAAASIPAAASATGGYSAYEIGSHVLITSASDPDSYMVGVVQNYSNGKLQVVAEHGLPVTFMVHEINGIHAN